MNHIEELINRMPELAICKEDIERATDLLYDSYLNKGTILICGNGGSAADAEHISGELLKGFLMRRTPNGADVEKIGSCLGSRALAEKLQGGIPAIPLTSLSSLLSAFANDVDPELVFGQLVYALGREGDAFWGLSTSGNSKNVVAAAN
ncbi:MAG: SIS domain-containing protein, partial [Clostridia bacterium]|nr:SIS domain-containing protein [Clostridia bacterium]